MLEYEVDQVNADMCGWAGLDIPWVVKVESCGWAGLRVLRLVSLNYVTGPT